MDNCLFLIWQNYIKCQNQEKHDEDGAKTEKDKADCTEASKKQRVPAADKSANKIISRHFDSVRPV